MAKAADRKAAGKRPKAGANREGKKGQGALRPGNALKKSFASGKTNRTAPNGTARIKDGSGVHFRSEGAIKRLNMYNSKPNIAKMREQASGPVRIQPDRRWFGNTRVIAQEKMQQFRETLSKSVDDPYSVVLKSSKLPMSLLRDTAGKASKMDLLSVEPFKETFGKRRRQKRVRLGSYDMEDWLKTIDEKADGYNELKDKKLQMDFASGIEKETDDGHQAEEIFNKGTSRRIWGELYKVLDASDVMVFVLDARDPMGTRCHQLEAYIKKNKPGKQVVLLLNKCDLVPTWVSREWVQVLTKEYPTLAFHASITNPFGKNALLNLLRQFGNLMKESKHITIGLVGYPNVGKSSVINTMKRKKVCKAAPIPGETRVWQYIALTKRLYLLDCPGIVPQSEKDFASDAGKVLKGVVRAERILSPSDYIDEVLSRVKKQYLLQRYKLPQDTAWNSAEEFLSILARKMGKLHKGGDEDIETVARVVLYDWQRGRIPFFMPPPSHEKQGEDGRVGGAAISSSSGAAGATVAGDGEAASTGEAKEGDEATKAESAGAAGDEAPQGPVIQQSLASFSEVVCSLQFDEEDRRGEAAVVAPESGEQAQPAKASKGRRKRKQAAVVSDAPIGGTSGEGRQADGARTGKRAKKNKSEPSSSSRPPMAVKTGSVDWKAVVSEFDM